MMKHNIFVVLLLTCCFLKSAENDIDRRVITGRLIFELGGIPEKEMQKLRDDSDRQWSGFNAFEFYLGTEKLSAFMAAMEKRIAPREPVIRREPVSCDVPQPQKQYKKCTQKQYYHKNNNRFDRQKHAQINMHVQQPRSKNKRRG